MTYFPSPCKRGEGNRQQAGANPLLTNHFADGETLLMSLPSSVDVAIIGWIRPEQKFASIDDLKRNMVADAAQARDALKRAGGAFPQLGAI